MQEKGDKEPTLEYIGAKRTAFDKMFSLSQPVQVVNNVEIKKWFLGKIQYQAQKTWSQYKSATYKRPFMHFTCVT